MTPTPKPAQSILLRICTVPLETFALKGSSHPMSLARNMEALVANVERDATRLADDLHKLINKGHWERSETKALGALRRRVLRLSALQPNDRQAVATLRNENEELALEILSLFKRREEMLELNCRFERALEDEPAAAAGKLWTACLEQPEICELLKMRDGAFWAECCEKGHDISHWTGKRGRHRAQYLKDILQRATFRTVPRDWHTIVTSLPVQKRGRAQPPHSSCHFKRVFRENLHRKRLDGSKGWTPQERNCPLSLSPLSWRDDDRIGFCVSDWEIPSKVQEVSLKASPFFLKLYDAMAGKVLSLAELEMTLQPVLDEQEQDILPQFIQHLISMGVVQACPPAETIATGWGTVEQLPSPAKTKQSDGFTDIYAKWQGSVSREQINNVQKGLAQLSRLSLLLDMANTPGPAPAVDFGQRLTSPTRRANLIPAIKEQLRPSDITVADNRTALSEPKSHDGPKTVEPSRHWPLPDNTREGYARLHTWLGAAIENGAPIRLPASMLDSCGAPEWDYPWPCDAMVRLARPDADYTGVFDEAFAAGSMDARFLANTGNLSSDYGNGTAYKLFLSELTRLTGIEFVELLFPPLSTGAANAVMRPDYGLRWTGDPAASTYMTGHKSPKDFIALHRFELAGTPYGQRLLLDGRKTIAMYHATRLPIAPWNLVTEKMLDAAPGNVRFSPRRLHRLLDAFPGASYAPRLELDGGLVCSCEQWRIEASELWAPKDTKSYKVKRLARLRSNFSLPRFLFLSAGANRKPVPVDLEDPTSIFTIEDIYQESADPLFIAQTPDTQNAFLRDGKHTYSSCAQIRLPADTVPSALAERLAPQLSALMVLP